MADSFLTSTLWPGLGSVVAAGVTAWATLRVAARETATESIEQTPEVDQDTLKSVSDAISTYTHMPVNGQQIREIQRRFHLGRNHQLFLMTHERDKWRARARAAMAALLTFAVMFVFLSYLLIHHYGVQPVTTGRPQANAETVNGAQPSGSGMKSKATLELDEPTARTLISQLKTGFNVVCPRGFEPKQTRTGKRYWQQQCAFDANSGGADVYFLAFQDYPGMLERRPATLAVQQTEFENICFVLGDPYGRWKDSRGNGGNWATFRDRTNSNSEIAKVWVEGDDSLGIILISRKWASLSADWDGVLTPLGHSGYQLTRESDADPAPSMQCRK